MKVLKKIQQKGDKNKIYSIHEPETSCIAKGKEAKKFEFGNKSGMVLTKTTKIVVGAIAFEDNPYDGHTLDQHLNQTEYLTNRRPKTGIVDRGYRGKKNINGTEIISPSVPKKGTTQYEKQKARKRFRARAGIEPVIGHIKHDHRMLRNYLKGVIPNAGDTGHYMIEATAHSMPTFKRRTAQIDWHKTRQNLFCRCPL